MNEKQTDDVLVGLLNKVREDDRLDRREKFDIIRVLETARSRNEAFGLQKQIDCLETIYRDYLAKSTDSDLSHGLLKVIDRLKMLRHQNDYYDNNEISKFDGGEKPRTVGDLFERAFGEDLMVGEDGILRIKNWDKVKDMFIQVCEDDGMGYAAHSGKAIDSCTCEELGAIQIWY